ncbi:MAG: 50S ribosomal protein L30, partial [Acidimicrobiia bacterium]|nr:50S ribosomal protein L30 [Acidimicrobiia bacterium]
KSAVVTLLGDGGHGRISYFLPVLPALRKIGDTNTLPDRPEIRGMIARVPHLIDIVVNDGKGS